MAEHIDTEKRYTCPQWRGVALYVSGFPAPETCSLCDGSGGWFPYIDPADMFAPAVSDVWEDCSRCGGIGELPPDDAWCYVTMVGDDTRHLVEISELTEIDPLSYCSECGQLGCTHDGREREQ